VCADGVARGLEAELAGFAVGVHQDGLPIADFSFEQQAPERRFDLLLDGGRRTDSVNCPPTFCSAARPTDVRHQSAGGVAGRLDVHTTAFDAETRRIVAASIPIGK
jgi:hypothetical protein